LKYSSDLDESCEVADVSGLPGLTAAPAAGGMDQAGRWRKRFRTTSAIERQKSSTCAHVPLPCCTTHLIPLRAGVHSWPSPCAALHARETRAAAAASWVATRASTRCSAMSRVTLGGAPDMPRRSRCVRVHTRNAHMLTGFTALTAVHSPPAAKLRIVMTPASME
jgi:hypothetical protein